MTPTRTSYIANGGLFALMIGLFVVLFSLNTRQYRAALAAAEKAVGRTLETRVAQMTERLVFDELDLIARVPHDRVPTVPVFVYRNNTFTPACLMSYTKGAVSEKAAAASFAEGVKILPSPEAEDYFATAAAGPSNTPEALYRKISALFNLMEFSNDPALTCSIIALLDDDKLPSSRMRFFESMLAERVLELPRIRAELAKRRAEANQLNQLRLKEPLPIRRMVNDRMLSVLEDGFAVFYELDLPAAPFGEWARKPSSRSRELCPGLHAVVNNELIDREKQRLANQHRRDTAALSLMVLLAMFLFGGIIAASRRQRKLEAARTRFIATVSHELRTPLSLIRLHAETLMHGRVPAGNENDYHQTILTEAERLTGIVNNVLDFSRMERDKLRVHLEPTDLSELTARVADSFRDRLRQDHIALERNIGVGISGLVDPLAYSQVVFNLLDNAIKYSDGAKTIRMGLEVSTGWNNLSVADQGIGIPNKLKKHIFDEFVRSDDRKVTARRGSGIGLNVAKRLVEKMNGTIEVADNEPKGSIFTVRVPPASSGPRFRQDGGDTKGENETTGG